MSYPLGSFDPMNDMPSPAIGGPTSTSGDLERATATLIEAGFEFVVVEETRQPAEPPVAA